MATVEIDDSKVRDSDLATKARIEAKIEAINQKIEEIERSIVREAQSDIRALQQERDRLQKQISDGLAAKVNVTLVNE